MHKYTYKFKYGNNSLDNILVKLINALAKKNV